VIIRNKFSDDDIHFILLKKIDNILCNKFCKNFILEELRNLRDLLDRYC